MSRMFPSGMWPTSMWPSGVPSSGSGSMWPAGMWPAGMWPDETVVVPSGPHVGRLWGSYNFGLVVGDEYTVADGTAIVFAKRRTEVWPDLTGAEISLDVLPDVVGDVSAVIDTPDGDEALFYLEFVNPAVVGRFRYRVRAVLSDGNDVTLRAGMIVISDLSIN